MWRSISSLLKGRDNNFNLLRLIAASMVIVSHSWPLRFGPAAQQPLAGFPFLFFGHPVTFTLGILAVQVFFVISGFLITQSFVRRPSIWSFVIARALRILPALFVVNLVCVFLLGPLFTTAPLGQYFSEPGTWRYLFANTLLYQFQFELPGVFAKNAYRAAVNGSLWSLPNEVWCYVFVLVCGLPGLYRREIGAFVFMLLAFFLLYCTYLYPAAYAGLLAGKPLLPQYVRFLGFSFVLGQLLFLFREWIPVGWAGLVVALGGCVASLYLGWTSVGFNLCLAYLVINLALVPGGVIRRHSGQSDISYGVYLYGFPVQQVLMALSPGMSHAIFVALSLVIVAGLAWFSWVAVEAPALKLAPRQSPRRSPRGRGR